MDGVLGEGNANRVANAVRQQRTDPDGGLDAAILAIACLGDPKVDRVIPVRSLDIEPSDEQAIGLDHDLGIRGLHRENEVVITLLTGEAGEFQSTLDHAVRRISETVHDAVGQRAVIGADSHRATEVLAELHQWHELLADALQFLGILGVAVFADFEFLLVGVVARIHADFLDPLGSLHRGVRLEMDIRHQRHAAARSPDLANDVFQIRGVNFGLCGDADDLTPGGIQLEHFFHAGRGVASVRGDHRLDADRIAAADAHTTDRHFAGFATGIAQKGWAVAQRIVHLENDVAEKRRGGNGPGRSGEQIVLSAPLGR